MISFRMALVAVVFGVIMLGLAGQFNSPNAIKSYLPVSEMVDAIQKQGKLVVISTTIVSEATSTKNGWFTDASVTTTERNRIEYSMDLHKLNRRWIVFDGHKLVITLPDDFIVADIIPLNTTETSTGWTWSNSEKIPLHYRNLQLIKDDINARTHTSLSAFQPNASEELKSLFDIPIKAVNKDVTVEVKWNN